MSSMTRFCSSSGMSLMPNARVAERRSGAITALEKYCGTRSSRPRMRACVAVEAEVVNRSGSESAGHSSARPQPRASV